MENILNLPDEILAKILRCLPNRFNYAPVCQRFYELICDIDRFKYKLRLGNVGKKDRTTVMNTKRIFDTMDVNLDVVFSDDASFLRDVYQRHGKTVKNLKWSFWSAFKYKKDDVVEIFNFMPNLEKLELNSWNIEFKKSKSSVPKTLNLQKLKSLSYKKCDVYSIEFITNIFPKNVLKQLKICEMPVSTEIFRKIFDKQPLVECLDIVGYYTDASAFQILKLKQLQYDVSGLRSELLSGQRDFFKNLILSQPAMTELDTVTHRDSLNELIDDKLFKEIVKLTQLKSLKLNIDLISPDVIVSIVKLDKLKSLEVFSRRPKDSLQSFNALSSLKFTIENLVLNFWDHNDIPQQTYRQFAENFHLKSFKIEKATNHPLSFFIESFPSLESMSIDLRRSFTGNETIVHENLKNLEINFIRGEFISGVNLMKILGCFRNLESFKIFAIMPFSTSVFNIFSSHLKLKNLELHRIIVTDGETFPVHVIETLKTLAKKLKFSRLNFQYKRTHLSWGPSPLHPFSFEPLKTAVKYDFDIKEVSWGNVMLTSGVEGTMT